MLILPGAESSPNNLAHRRWKKSAMRLTPEQCCKHPAMRERFSNAANQLEQIRQTIAANLRMEVQTGAAQNGSALLVGPLCCRRRGRKLIVRYTGQHHNARVMPVAVDDSITASPVHCLAAVDRRSTAFGDTLRRTCRLSPVEPY